MAELRTNYYRGFCRLDCGRVEASGYTAAESPIPLQGVQSPRSLKAYVGLDGCTSLTVRIGDNEGDIAGMGGDLFGSVGIEWQQVATRIGLTQLEECWKL